MSSTQQDNAAPAPNAWEQAYLRFETPEEEIAKFTQRLRLLGAGSWPRSAEVVEIFCGRGNGLVALERLGFTRLEGVDLSPPLLAPYKGSARTVAADCRKLPFADRSRDILIVQGGLHHLPKLPDDLEQTVAEAARVLRDGGRFMVIEPWDTPFLRFVHGVMRIKIARKLWDKLDALAVMTEHEATTYFQWLGQPEVVLAALRQRFDQEHCSFRWGKIRFVGKKK
ncbi:MAG: class I SAM-dependent methyltransferase [Verrucomicrobia bacterium]|nr:class I SAM-dependent methyltransferase [Verrucomicrobiota bacterium]